MNPGAPDGRFNDKDRNAGLAFKSREYLPAGIAFVPVKPIYIEDPHPNVKPWQEAGEVGDVGDPGGGLRPKQDDGEPFDPPSTSPPSGPSVGSAAASPALGVPASGQEQIRAIQEACLRHPARAKGALMEILIRRFVSGIDNDNDFRVDEDSGAGLDNDNLIAEDWIEKAGLLGISPTPPCSMEPASIMRTPITVDPEYFNHPFNFGVVLAHEDGHALCLGHAKVGDAPRIMSPNAPPFASGFTRDEIAVLRKQAQHLSATRDKDSQGQTLARPGPITFYELSEARSVRYAPTDIFGVGAAMREDGDFGLILELREPFPETMKNAEYAFFIDADGNAESGWRGEPMQGADIKVVVRADVKRGVLSKSARVHVLESGRTRAADELLRGLRVEPVLLGDAPLNQVVHVVLRTEKMTPRIEDRYRVIAIASQGGKTVSSPIVAGSTMPVSFNGPTIDVGPPRSRNGQLFVGVAGNGFSRNGKVDLYLGGVFVRTEDVDADGRFKTNLEVGNLPPDAYVELPNRSRASAVLAYDSAGGGDGFVVTLPGGTRGAAIE